TPASTCDDVQGGVKLLATLAPQRAEDVASHALGVNPDQNLIGVADVSGDQRHVLHGTDPEGKGPEPAAPGHQVGLGDVVERGMRGWLLGHGIPLLWNVRVVGMNCLPLPLGTTEEARGRTVAVLPVGSFEQHGPYLPLATDTLVASAIAAEIAA